MSNANRKPFDLDAALSGGKVIDGNGNTVTNLTKFPGVTENSYNLAGVINGNIRVWQENGNYMSSSGSKHDLYMEVKEVTKWLNVYTSSGIGSYFHDTEEAADSIAGNKERLNGGKAVKVTYFE